MKKKSKTILEEKGKAIVFTFGRFQPPTAGHQLLMDKVKSVAKKSKAEHRIFTSSTNDKKKNPLTHKEKVSYMKKFFKGMNISTDSSIRTPFEALQSMSDEGYKHVIMVVGGDRVDEFRKRVVKYIGDDGYQFDSFNVVSAGKRDPDAEDVTGMSASKMRKAASDGDFATFIKGLPSTSNITLSKKLYNSLRKRMKITEKVDNINKKKKLPVEDGTDESREDRQKLTPGQSVEKYTKETMNYIDLKIKLDEGKTEFAVVATASKMLIKAFPTEKQARQYIKNQYTRKSLIGNLAIMEVPKSRPPGNQMKGDMEVVKESVEHLDEGLTARHLSMSGEGRELWLYIDNDAQLYKQQGLPIIKNLMTKKAQGKYDSKLAAKLYMYLVDNGAKKYVKEHGSKGYSWTTTFDKKTRMEVAKELVSSFESEAESGAYDNFIPKKYQQKESVSIEEEISPEQAKKMGINMPLSGKGYPYNESYINSRGEKMKTYKDFKNTLSEQGEYTPSGMKHTGSDARDSNVPLHDLGNPEALGAVNAFIEQYTSQEYMNPRQAVAQLRARLNTCGLHFDFQPNGTVVEGTEEYPLTLFGGRSGWDMEKGGMSEDDGITPKLGYGLSMQIEYTVAESGLYRIGAKIIKQTKAKGE